MTKRWWGMVFAALGVLAGAWLLYWIPATYNTVIHTHYWAGEWQESNTVRIVYAVLGWLGTAAGALSVVVLWGFWKRQSWAWFWGIVAATVLILAGFFPMIPAADSDLPTPTMWAFLLATVMWFGMIWLGGVERRVAALAFIAGIAYVLTFINGVAPISKFQVTFQWPAHFEPGPKAFWNGMYIVLQQVNWWGAAAWAMFIFGSVRRRAWSMPVGLFAGVLSMSAGYILGLSHMLEVHRFSMFLPAPLVSTGLTLALLHPQVQAWLGLPNTSP